MVKYFQTGLVIVYILLTSSLVLWILFLCGLHLSKLTMTLLLLVWGIICFASFYFQAPSLPFSPFNVRKPVIPEEEILNNCLSEVRSRANYSGHIQMLISEELVINAFAAGQNTIVISKGTLNNLTGAEIKAVIAHELGHTMSRDVLFITAFVTATRLPQTITIINSLFAKLFRGCLSAGCLLLFACLVISIASVYIFHLHHLIVTIAAIIILIYISSTLEPLFIFFWRMVARFIEYKQDAFAWSLGYGKDLKSALYKISQEQVQMVNLFHILITSTHPVIFNRIRHLEKMEGLR